MDIKRGKVPMETINITDEEDNEENKDHKGKIQNCWINYGTPLTVRQMTKRWRNN